MEEILFCLGIFVIAGLGGIGVGMSTKEEIWTKECDAHQIHIASNGAMYKCEKVK